MNSDLGTLSDTDGTAGSDSLVVNATDSFGNKATQQTIAVTATNEDDWTGAAGDGNWATPGNWSNGVVPNASMTAVLGPAGTYPVTSSGDVAVAALTIASTATLDITGGTFTAGSVSNAGTVTFGNATVTGTSFNDPGTIQVVSGTTLTLAGTDSITGGKFFIFVGSPQPISSNPTPTSPVLLPFVFINDLNADDPMVTLTIQSNQANALFAGISGSS